MSHDDDIATRISIDITLHREKSTPGTVVFGAEAKSKAAIRSLYITKDHVPSNAKAVRVYVEYLT